MNKRSGVLPATDHDIAELERGLPEIAGTEFEFIGSLIARIRFDQADKAEIVKEASFLIDRLDDYDPGEDGLREFCGHVVPSLERLRNLIGGDRWSA